MRKKKSYIKYSVQRKLRDIGHSFAVHEWENFLLHPEYRGSNFRWKRFPWFVGRLIKANIFMSFRRRLRETEVRYARACGIRRTRQLMRLMPIIRGLEKID